MAVDQDEIQRWYEKLGPMVFRRCMQLLHNEQQAKDTMQDVFVKVLQSKDSLNDEGVSSLLYRIATNESLNRLRSSRRKPETQDQDLVDRIVSGINIEDHLGAKEVLGKLFGAEQVSTQVIATLHLLDGLTLEQVAKEVNMSVSGVRKRLRRLKSNLVELKEVV
jgi:RNA polymerase sigma factor (sigma-70 family)